MPTPPLGGLGEPAQQLSLVEYCKATLPGSSPGNTVLRAREGKASPRLQAFSYDDVNLSTVCKEARAQYKKKKNHDQRCTT